MSLDIHPSAALNFDTKAAALVQLITEVNFPSSSQTGFSSELHIAAAITEADVIGDVTMSSTDYRGKTVARFFEADRKKYGIQTDSYPKVIALAEAMQALPALRSKLSTNFIENALFLWIKRKFVNSEAGVSFISFLDQQAEASIKKITLWTPVANLEIEVPIAISRSELRPLSKKVIDQWEQRCIAFPGGNKESISVLIGGLRKKYQGLAAVVTTVEAEPERAREFAMEEATRITSLLGIFSGAVQIPDIKCASRIKGTENLATATTILEFDVDDFQVNSSLLDKASAKTWRLNRNEIADIKALFLDKVSPLLAAESLNAFETSALNSILLYSKSAFTSDPVEKLVYMLSSLESILLKSENEPIMQNLAERLAIFTVRGLDARKKIIKSVKTVYAIRSRYLHHGHNHAELEELSEFMLFVWQFYMQLAANIGRFSTKDNFVCVLDDHKLG